MLSKMPLCDVLKINKDKSDILYLEIRRVVEVFILIITFPVIVLLFSIIYILIKQDSPGSVLFSQLRPGKGGKPFLMYKFRSMYLNADSSYLTLHSDSRITRVGKFIRKYRIDELPQIINILKGEMSIIGPRPVPLNFLHKYEKEINHYQLRHSIRPGITGLAQVRQGYTTTIEEERRKLKYDLFYINTISFKLDMIILLSSIKLLFSGLRGRVGLMRL